MKLSGRYLATLFVMVCSAGWSNPGLAQAYSALVVGLSPAERNAVVDASVEKLTQEYLYPEVAKQMARAIRARLAKGEYKAIATAPELADKLTADLREISHDKHLRIEYHAEGALDGPAGEPSVEQLDAMRPFAARDNFAFDQVQRMDGNIGYLEFRAFVYPALAADTARAAMSFLAHSDALIIDLRHNFGGDPAMVALLASYLFDERTHLNDIVFRRDDRRDQYWTSIVTGAKFGGRKPVYLLLSQETFSAAEDFAFALKNLKRATIVGETSGGGAHPQRVFKLTEHFAISVPFARSLSPLTHTDWEGVGVTPDLAVPAAGALNTAYRAALENLVETSGDEARKAQWRALLEKQK
jgi:retinol-binding protein 3